MEATASGREGASGERWGGMTPAAGTCVCLEFARLHRRRFNENRLG